jgi:hypothetical protein
MQTVSCIYFKMLKIIIFFLIVIVGVYSFSNPLTPVEYYRRTKGFGAGTRVLPDIPSTEKARLKLVVKGPSVGSALFRAELKKELTFFRGCACLFSYDDSKESAEIISEGKTQQLIKFFDWCVKLNEDMSQRKPSFQGPPLFLSIDKASWEEYQGDLKGFTAENDIPMLGKGASDATIKEAISMAGTDESV